MPNSVAVLDQFHGAASTLLAAHTPDEGTAWSIPGGRAPALDGTGGTRWTNAGGITVPNPNADPAPQALQSGLIAGDVSLLFAYADLGGAGEQQDALGAIARYTSTTAYYAVVYNPSNLDVELQKRSGGDQLTIATSLSLVASEIPTPILWQISGADHAIWVPGQDVVTFTDTDSPFLDPGQVGIAGNGQGLSSPTTGCHLSQFLAIAGLLRAMP